MSKNYNNAINQILDLLLDALVERQQDRATGETDQSLAEEETQPKPVAIDTFDGPMLFEADANESAERDNLTEPGATDDAFIENDLNGQIEQTPQAVEPMDHVEAEPDEIEFNEAETEPRNSNDADATEINEEYAEVYLNPPEKLPSINMNKIFYRLSVVLALLIVLINIPFNRYGTNLARAMPDEQALIVRDGLIFTGPGSEVYILEDNQKRWISSLTAFELLGFHWNQVHEVEQAFVDQFADGPDLHVIIRCDRQPHIYLLEGSEKRWIKNPAAFEKAGLQWEDVRYISCFDLKNKYPDGIPIPADAGDPPQW